MAAALLLGVALASCSSDDDAETTQSAQTAQASESAATPTAAASPTGPDPCASAEALRTSLGALDDVQVVEDGVAALAEAWSPVQDDAEALADAARAEFSDDVAAVQEEAAAVRDALGTTQATPSPESLRSTAVAVRSFVAAADVLVTEVTSTC